MEFGYQGLIEGQVAKGSSIKRVLGEGERSGAREVGMVRGTEEEDSFPVNYE